VPLHHLFVNSTASILAISIKHVFKHLCAYVEGKKESFPKFKRIICLSHPPYAENLANHIKRANNVAKMWENANRTHSTCRENAENYGWKVTCNDEYDASLISFSGAVTLTLWVPPLLVILRQKSSKRVMVHGVKAVTIAMMTKVYKPKKVFFMLLYSVLN